MSSYDKGDDIHGSFCIIDHGSAECLPYILAGNGWNGAFVPPLPKNDKD